MPLTSPPLLSMRYRQVDLAPPIGGVTDRAILGQ